ncbi:hypothetical protein MRB53_011743 [Persea americana]|uniref:Uncharacterized protein n=1 Tax=Persea americana TaxID=3435 RepID=A0ACC2LWK1_PERAE|nr:hypothetical protein MRB53_011743 [Persea americana]
MKGTIRFGQKGKLSPRFIGPFKIQSRIGNVAYRLDLPAELSGIHNVFHVLMLRKYVSDPSHVIRHEEIQVLPDTAYVEKPIQIVDTKEIKSATVDGAFRSSVVMPVISDQDTGPVARSSGSETAPPTEETNPVPPGGLNEWM